MGGYTRGGGMWGSTVYGIVEGLLLRILLRPHFVDSVSHQPPAWIFGYANLPHYK